MSEGNTSSDSEEYTDLKPEPIKTVLKPSQPLSDFFP